MELFREYVMEKDGAELLTVDGAFLTYIFAENALGKQFYISDFHLGVEKRNSKVFLRLMRAALEIADQHKCNVFTCHVPLNIKDLSDVVFLRLKFGFKLLGAEGNRLSFTMPVERVREWAKQ